MFLYKIIYIKKEKLEDNNLSIRAISAKTLSDLF